LAKEDKNMAIVLMEEVLMGLEDAKDSLEQAVLTLEGMTEDMHPDMADLREVIEQTLLLPLQSRAAVLETLLEEVADTIP
jgi:hypothetical protein